MKTAINVCHRLIALLMLHEKKTTLLSHDVQMFAQNDFFNWPLKNIVMMLAKEAFNFFALMKTFKLVAGTSSIA